MVFSILKNKSNIKLTIFKTKNIFFGVKSKKKFEVGANGPGRSGYPKQTTYLPLCVLHVETARHIIVLPAVKLRRFKLHRDISSVFRDKILKCDNPIHEK